ncbi:MAG: alpha/beta hydrolase [Terriglobia bacterium]|nr:MAG: alpha/beta hydrolase [Terriglobia bacterium]
MPNTPIDSLVLLPGLLCDGSVWRFQVDALAKFALCTSVEWGTQDSLTAMAEKVLREAPARFAVAGHSMGGRVALEVYRRAPERVRRIALLNSGYQARPRGAAGEEEEHGRLALLEIARTQGMRAMALQWLPPMIHPERRTDSDLVEGIVEMFARKTPGIFAKQICAMLNRPDAEGVLQSIRCPALVLTGREDEWSPPDRHEEMAARIPGSRLLLIPECGHMSLLERPEAVAKALQEWLTT